MNTTVLGGCLCTHITTKVSLPWCSYSACTCVTLLVWLIRCYQHAFECYELCDLRATKKTRLKQQVSYKHTNKHSVKPHLSFTLFTCSLRQSVVACGFRSFCTRFAFRFVDAHNKILRQSENPNGNTTPHEKHTFLVDHVVSASGLLRLRTHFVHKLFAFRAPQQLIPPRALLNATRCAHTPESSGLTPATLHVGFIFDGHCHGGGLSS